ncbi:glutamine--tRNA ligase/YqeY domain fusion protein [Suttonella sp. R2A3]|uniref:glutamine--tRNA ligase/YqeY domain fusion protein n=1 Tax=Suttonella sp. R2A3 TaxID=2908648 RepID=UPI001F4024D9|nr:glutamine--tRNA ligase/YqeY domain fusion protein [Suttonella sp. R2A3]UJF24745.1 glutamine--tRNA ligase/YqeY domain fusion protein [Suttonella sp. R2A3]
MSETPAAANFIKNIITEDVANGKNSGNVITRFPPEPNGYLHLGHVKSICLNFGMAETFNGYCNLRFDDTNPEKEDAEYMDAIKQDVKWLGFTWKDAHHASDYFPQLLDFAYQLIDKGLAYVDSQDGETIREQRGTLTEPGINSPYRERSVTENREIFDAMVAGDYDDGAHVLRAKIDMTSPNINLRDPVIYRIRHHAHFHAGDQWKVYPMYDYTHCLSDMIEGITHSLCTLEFENNRPLYDWVLDALETPCHPQQIEFSRLNLEYTVLSKRRLIQLVQEGHVDGWDDPRMPTIVGMRRRGITPRALREFCRSIGISKSDGTVAMSHFESIIRDDLNQHATRRMAVLQPLKVTITTLDPSYEQTLSLPNHPQNPNLGTREVPFGNTLYIEQDDYSDEPPRKWKRLAQGQAVRLRGSYVITCDEVIRDDQGKVIELKCSHDPDTLGKNPEGYKPNGVIHWVSAAHALDAEIRQYGLLFNQANPMAAEHFIDTLNTDSLETLHSAKVEPAAREEVGTVYQFERQGYYAIDPDSDTSHLVFNRTVALRDSWK